MSIELFSAYNTHMVHREVLAHHKSVMLKTPQVLQLVCEDLNICSAYCELLYAAQKGHLLLRVRPFLQHQKACLRDGLIAVINKHNYNPIKLLGAQHREPESQEVQHINNLVNAVFR